MQSYSEILENMKNAYEEKTGTLPDRASDIGVRLEVVAGEIFSAWAEMNWLKNQMFPQTAEGEYLDMHASQRGLTRKNGTKAVGEVEFFVQKELSYDVEIPQGTVVATWGDNQARFVTIDNVVLVSGELSVSAEIEALREGISGNVAAEEINMLVTSVIGIDGVRNVLSTKNGSDTESDDQLRARILDSFINISNGTNKAYYIKTAMDIEGVTAAGIIPRNRGCGTVDVFITNADGNPSDDLLERVKSALDKQREINVDIEVKPLQRVEYNVAVYVTPKDGWSFSKVKENCKESIYEYFRLLSAGETVYLSDIGEYIEHTEGVKNYSFVYQIMSDTNITNDKIFCPGMITIAERDE